MWQQGSQSRPCWRVCAIFLRRLDPSLRQSRLRITLLPGPFSGFMLPSAATMKWPGAVFYGPNRGSPARSSLLRFT
jgi:hypothetical protein